MSESPRGPSGAGYIVVGVSPTSGSPAALRWAAEEARRRGARLRAVSVWQPSRQAAVTGIRPPLITTPTVEERQAAAVLHLTNTVHEHLGPDTDVECQVLIGSLESVLLSATTDAVLLVLGRVREDPAGGGVGRSLYRLIMRCPCPVIMVPDD